MPKISSYASWDLNPHVHLQVSDIYPLVNKHSLKMIA